jgi:2-phospho-L-lactate guanylyltransferase
MKELNKSSLITNILLVSSDKYFRDVYNNEKIEFLTDFNEGVNKAISLADSHLENQRIDASIVIPIDLPLITSCDVDYFCRMSMEFLKCVIICPSKRLDGTNIMLRKPHNVIKTHYDDNSYQNHFLEAKLHNVPIKPIYRDNLTFDIDTREDLILLTKIGNWENILEKLGLFS